MDGGQQGKRNPHVTAGDEDFEVPADAIIRICKGVESFSIDGAGHMRGWRISDRARILLFLQTFRGGFLAAKAPR